MKFFKLPIFVTLVVSAMLVCTDSSAQLKQQLHDVKWGDQLVLDRLAHLSGESGIVGLEEVVNNDDSEVIMRCYIIKNDTQMRAAMAMELTVNLDEGRVVKITQSSKSAHETDVFWSSIETYNAAEIIQTGIASAR